MSAPGEYFISFDTKINPGKIQAVKITIELVTFTDRNTRLPIDLCNHPLYKELKEYVAANS